MKRWLSFFSGVIVTAVAFASEHGEAPPADAHGGGGGAAPAASAPPWSETQSRMLVYKGQRQQLMSEMKKLHEDQQHVKMGTPEMKRMGQEIAKKYKEYREITEEYNKLLTILRYRFPERLAKEALKIHQTEEVPSLEDLEHQMDLDARLTQTLMKAREQYGNPNGITPVDAGRVPSSVAPSGPDSTPTDSTTPPTLRDTPPLRLRK